MYAISSVVVSNRRPLWQHLIPCVHCDRWSFRTNSMQPMGTPSCLSRLKRLSKLDLKMEISSWSDGGGDRSNQLSSVLIKNVSGYFPYWCIKRFSCRSASSLKVFLLARADSWCIKFVPSSVLLFFPNFSCCHTGIRLSVYTLNSVNTYLQRSESTIFGLILELKIKDNRCIVLQCIKYIGGCKTILD